MRRAVSLPAIAIALALPVLVRGADARRGEALFVGSARLANGGAPCLACHGLAGHGLAWSASFGPDLSDASQAYDESSLAGALEDVPFPTMEPIYRAHALAPEERADLAAFLLSSPPAGARGDARWRLAAEAGAVAVAILAALLVLDRRRMPPVDRALLRARRGKEAAP